MKHHYATGKAGQIMLLIDGECYLCHTITKFVVKRDFSGRFRFASIQSQVGQSLLMQRGLPRNDLNTFVMLTGHASFTKSEAALLVLRHLGKLWPVLYGFIVVPAFIRDWVYDQIAGRRHRWFMKKTTCLIPTAELRSRFIDRLDRMDWGPKQ